MHLPTLNFFESFNLPNQVAYGEMFPSADGALSPLAYRWNTITRKLTDHRWSAIAPQVCRCRWSAITYKFGGFMWSTSSQTTGGVPSHIHKFADHRWSAIAHTQVCRPQVECHHTLVWRLQVECQVCRPHVECHRTYHPNMLK